MDRAQQVPARRKIRDSLQDRILYTAVGAVLFVITLAVLYPIIYVLSASFSDPLAVSAGRVVLWPINPGLQGYRVVFSHRHILLGYRNTLFYTGVGTVINVGMTMIAAYPLARRDFPLRRALMFFFTFTMFFGGGLIPTYILMTQIHFVNTVWSLLIPGALSVYNMILVRTFIMGNIPTELLEAAQIDGCSDTRYFFTMVLPLSKAVIAVITLFYAVGHWNAYFGAMIYLNDINLYPLQIILRNILVANQVNLNEVQDAELLAGRQGMADLLKYALIVVSSGPIIALYPFVQRFFIKGVMIGSLKG